MTQVMLEEQQVFSPTILIVDDEESICKTLEGIFRDESFNVAIAHDGNTALRLIDELNPDLVLLDIWMPVMDGIETLSRIKERKNTPVIMISGHANIATAMKATRLGAEDFIEKPLDLNSILHAVRRVLGASGKIEYCEDLSGELDESLFRIGHPHDLSKIKPVPFYFESSKGRRFSQRTIAHSSLLYGQGLHSGKKSGLILEPLPPNMGIHFTGVTENDVIPAFVDYVDSTGFATSLKVGQTRASTIEHLMSALCAYGITNLMVKCNGEVPVMDGSSAQFCSLIEEIGIEDQDAYWHEVLVPETIRVERGEEFIQIEPSDELVIDYTLKYPEPVGNQRMVFTLSSPEDYKSQIAPARTFGFVKDIGHLQKSGLALGGRFDNFVLFGEGGPINCKLRFDNEPVRHKILDAIGDLYLLNRRLCGKITACMTGHSDNIDLLRKIKERLAVN